MLQPQAHLQIGAAHLHHLMLLEAWTYYFCSASGLLQAGKWGLCTHSQGPTESCLPGSPNPSPSVLVLWGQSYSLAAGAPETCPCKKSDL